MNPVVFNVGNFAIKWYSLLILIGILLAYFIIIKESKKFKINTDFAFNIMFWTFVIGIIGARIYYVIFNYSLYKDNPLDILKIWEGGLAIHGGVIFGIITVILYSKKYKVNTIKMFDIFAPALILAQAIGRWGNFFNSEAHGYVVSLDYLQKLYIPKFIIEGMNINGLYYHPTFLYESLWCLLGFLIILIIRRFKYIKTGTIFAFYLIYYSIGRFFIESIRTDSLMVGGLKIAQLVSIFMIIIGIGIIILNSKKGKFEDLYNKEENNIYF